MELDHGAFSDCKLVELHIRVLTSCLMYFYLQEIYPPKLSEFAYVTDGACTESEILSEELLMLKVTNHSVTFFTE